MDLIKCVAMHPRTQAFTHVVFNAVHANEKVEAEVPVRPRFDEGNDASPAERNSLMVLNNLETVLIEATPDKLPAFLEYDGEKLAEVGDSVTVADLIIPAGVELKTEDTHAVATVYEPSAVAAANDAAGGDAEPEDAENVEATAESDSGDSEKTDEPEQKTES